MLYKEKDAVFPIFENFEIEITQVGYMHETFQKHGRNPQYMGDKMLGMEF